jgi:hypothetical protein
MSQGIVTERTWGRLVSCRNTWECIMPGSAYIGGVPGTNSKGSFVYQVLTVKGHLKGETMMCVAVCVSTHTGGRASPIY